MPVVRISISENADDSKIKTVLEQVSAMTAKILSKPENYVETIFQGNIPMAFGGTFDPAAFVEIKSIGGLTPENCRKITSEITEILQKNLCIPSKRTYVEFLDAKPTMFGWDKSTF